MTQLAVPPTQPLPQLAEVVASAGTWITVALPDGGGEVTCARIRNLPPVKPGDSVLVQPVRGGHVVTGVLDCGTPDELVIEAGRQLIIRCGAGSLTIRHDGRVLIQGLDVVTRAARANRIKGSHVVIN